VSGHDSHRGHWDGRGDQGHGDWAHRGDWGRGWARRGWGWGWFNPWFFGGWYNPWWYGGAYAYGDYWPGYSSYYEGSPVYPYVEEVPPPESYTDQSIQSADENAAMIAVRVPANAELWFDGQKTSQSGQVRQFETPSLDPAQEYAYEIRARWTENGRNVERSRTVSVRAGDRLGVNFIAFASAG
jgi:uncharacterized protein (TIGR03000 family)